jgi:hypothetical protein
MVDMARGNQAPDVRGPAAALVAALQADGVDLLDQSAVDAWVDAFNARPYDERAQVLSDDVVGGGLPLAAVDVPCEDDARRSAASSPLLHQFRALVDFVGEGRKLTQTGNVTLADARELVRLLRTGDQFDAQIGARTFRTRSADELPGLRLVVRLAKAARFVRPAKGRLLATKAGRQLGRDPLADLERLVAAIEEAGMCSVTDGGGRFIWSSLAPYFDNLFVPLAVRVITDVVPVPFDELVERAFEQFDDEVELDGPHWSERNRRRVVEGEISGAIEVLESAGLVTWASENETSEWGRERRVAGTVEATPAGRWALHRYLQDHYGVPLAVARPPEHTDADFEALLAACGFDGSADVVQLGREVTAWVEQRGVGAIAELAHAARTSDDPDVRAMALTTMLGAFGPGPEPEMRALLDHPRTRGAALVWLVDHDCEPADVLLDRDPVVLTDVLALTLLSRGPGGVLELFEHLGPHDAQVAAVQQLWRQPHPAVPDVLDLVGRHHPTAAVAKAARKASMQRASYLADAGHR